MINPCFMGSPCRESIKEAFSNTDSLCISAKIKSIRMERISFRKMFTAKNMGVRTNVRMSSQVTSGP